MPPIHIWGIRQPGTRMRSSRLSLSLRVPSCANQLCIFEAPETHPCAIIAARIISNVGKTGVIQIFEILLDPAPGPLAHRGAAYHQRVHTCSVSMASCSTYVDASGEQSDFMACRLSRQLCSTCGHSLCFVSSYMP